MVIGPQAIESDPYLGRARVESEEISEGVNFSKCQMSEVVGDYNSGRKVELESFSPYLADYNTVTGEVWEDKLTRTDAIGIEVAKMLREKFPQARMISLYDEYNSDLPYSTDPRGAPKPEGQQLEFSQTAKDNFRQNIENLLKKKGVIKEGGEYLFVSESEKVKDAEVLVEQLEEKGFIERDGEAIYFINPEAENPDYSRIRLRTKNGRWLCEALDASSYIKPENLEITHLVVLPEVFREQQDKVWEILRVLGIEPTHYHNIFFNEEAEPKKAAEAIRAEIEKYQ